MVASVTAVVVALTGCAHRSEHAGSRPRAAPVVIDTDMAADDIIALTFLLGSPRVDVVGVTVVGSGEVHCPAGGRHAAAVIAASGHAPVPVACGEAAPMAGTAAFPQQWREQADGFYGMATTWPSPSGGAPAGSDPVALMRRLATAHPGLTIVTLGPLTTVAKVLGDAAVRASRPHVVISGGVVDDIGNMPSAGRLLPVREWNIGVDPVAAETVMRSGVPMTWVPLDASDQVPLDGRFTTALAGMHRNRAGDAALTFMRANSSLARGGFYLWDPLDAVVATDPTVVTHRARNLVVAIEGSDAGRLVVDSNGPAVDVAMRTDVSRFATALLQGYATAGQPATDFPRATPSFTVDRLRGTFHFHGANRIAPGDVSMRFDGADDGFGIAVLRLAAGHDAGDIRALVASGVTTPPKWATLALTADVPDLAEPMWTVALQRGLHVIVAGNRNGTGLTVVAEVTVT